jgi:hypothetical protein
MSIELPTEIDRKFKKYIRTNIAEMLEITKDNIHLVGLEVSVSQADLFAGSPKPGDMIARNPNNHEDKWLVAEQYFKDNFKSLPRE